ncbi:MAG: FAD-dependent oxidoreductase [Deltaproteobacteria bacterium]|nr:FAD-dependent oxidoreductase [Deltaproteobacteria bacterium]
MRYLIVGSGPAGISAAEEIRREDPEGPITMITADPHPAASPVMLTYWVSGHFPRESLFFREMESWAAKHQVTLRCGEKVTAIDIHRQAVKLSAGGEIAYDRLLIATGAVPVIPPIPGIRAKGVYPFRTFADAEGILTARRDLEHVCIMGGGFIGIKLACHLRERGLTVSVFEKESRLASRIFDQRASDIVKEQLRRHGLSVETGAGIAEISNRDGWVSGVRLEDGSHIPAQILVAAVGVRPNTAFLDTSIAAPRGGIPVDERMETTVPNVYAAGDVATARDSLTSLPFNNAIWPAATRQGKVAGANMAGGCRAYVHNFSLNALNLHGLQVTTAGHPYEQEGDDILVFQEEKGNNYRKVILKSGALIGFILIGDTSPAGCFLSKMKRGDIISDPAELLAQGGDAPLGSFRNRGFRQGALWRQYGKTAYRYTLIDTAGDHHQDKRGDRQ